MEIPIWEKNQYWSRHHHRGDGTIPISHQLLWALHNRGIFYWDKTIHKWEGTIPIWKSASDLGLNDAMVLQWNLATLAMRDRGVFCTEDEDILIWKGLGGRSFVFVRHIYQFLLELEWAYHLYPM